MKKLILIMFFAFVGMASFANVGKNVKKTNFNKHKTDPQCGYSFWCNASVTADCGASYGLMLVWQYQLCGGGGQCEC